MDNTPKTEQDVILDLTTKFDKLVEELRQSIKQDIHISNGEDFAKLEFALHKKTREIADTISAIKLQETLTKTASQAEEKKTS